MSAREDGWKARQWWYDLRPKPEFPNGRNTAALAKLRRAHSWVEAAAVPETITLFRMLEKKHERDLPRVAVVAAVLAHVREENKNGSVAGSIGKAPNDSDTRAVLSELRLGRLLSVSGDDDILIAFRRLVALMGKTANVADLAEQILYWDHREWGDRRRVSFAFNYWQAGDAAPAPQATE
jgi:CRISPR system Cascade subunit CasB